MSLARPRNFDSLTCLLFLLGLASFGLSAALPDLAVHLHHAHPALYIGLKALLLFWTIDLLFCVLFRQRALSNLRPTRLIPVASLCLLIGLLALAAAAGSQHALSPILHLPQGQTGLCHGPCADALSRFGF